VTLIFIDGEVELEALVWLSNAPASGIQSRRAHSNSQCQSSNWLLASSGDFCSRTFRSSARLLQTQRV
jgi:hypothetical protein